jgi:lipoprotein-anchoring transpeptidase ErfK/SrfK
VHDLLQGANSPRPVAVFTILIAGVLVAAGLLGAAEPAAAQQGFGNYFGYETQRHPRRRAARHRGSSSEAKTAEKKKTDKKKEAKESAPKGPVYLVVSLADQHVSVYDSTGRIARSRVATGMPGHPTPTGIFSIIGKERWHHSNIYSGAPMPWMQRITWSGVAMHAGVVPGYPASHGCIRLTYAFAPQLWGITKGNERVVVARRDTVPFEITNAFLPLPKMQPAPTATFGSQQASRSGEPQIELASIKSPASDALATSAVPQAQDANAGAPKLLNPIAYAHALKEHAKADKAAADAAAKDALAAAQATGAQARQAVDDVHKAEAELKAAEAKITERLSALAAQESGGEAASAGQKADAAKTDAAKSGEKSANAAPAASLEDARQALTAAQSEGASARAALREAQRREAERTPAAFAAVQVWKRAVAASEAAAKTLKEADRRSDPVSVLISRKEGRVFIRQHWKDVYEAPVTIRDPDKPLGTHLFIAVAAEPDGSAMRWSAISVPEGSANDRRRSKKDKASKAPPAQAAAAETAAGALDRIELPPEARERISELLWTGASLIVSDHARSDEMDNDTDFIVSTR